MRSFSFLSALDAALARCSKGSGRKSCANCERETEQRMKKLYWRIEGKDSLTRIFERKVELGQFTENQMKHLLMALAAKAGLDYDEIVGAYATRRTRIAN